MLSDISIRITQHIELFFLLVVFLESLFPPSRQPSAWLLKKAVKLYQRVVAPYVPMQCRFQPTCSHYGYGCLDRFGSLWGILLILIRLLRCHPFSKGGEDPIPSPNDDPRWSKSDPSVLARRSGEMSDLIWVNAESFAYNSKGKERYLIASDRQRWTKLGNFHACVVENHLILFLEYFVMIGVGEWRS